MQRRAFVTGSLLAGPAAASPSTTAGAATAVAVLAELTFRAEAGARAAALLGDLAAATRREPGCRRYVVGQDPETPHRFHLSELWADRNALAGHFRTPHMAAFLSAAREIGYSTTFLKEIEIARIGDLDTRALIEPPRP